MKTYMKKIVTIIGFSSLMITASAFANTDNKINLHEINKVSFKVVKVEIDKDIQDSIKESLSMAISDMNTDQQDLTAKDLGGFVKKDLAKCLARKSLSKQIKVDIEDAMFLGKKRYVMVFSD